MSIIVRVRKNGNDDERTTYIGVEVVTGAELRRRGVALPRWFGKRILFMLDGVTPARECPYWYPEDMVGVISAHS